ncbi:MAG: PilZ domain-containing protein [Acidobacteriota bacterium]
MARRFQRTNTRVSVELISAAGKDKFEQPGSIMDVSRSGLRVQTGPRLTPGQFLHVFLTGRARPFARCRVVWAQTHGDALPSEAGLEILEGVSARATPLLALEPMPWQYYSTL